MKIGEPIDLTGKEAEKWKPKRFGRGLSQDYKNFVKALHTIQPNQRIPISGASIYAVRYYVRRAKLLGAFPENAKIHIIERDGEISLVRSE